MQESLLDTSVRPAGGTGWRSWLAKLATSKTGQKYRESATTVKFWGKKEDATAANRGVARAALQGASRLEIITEALYELRAECSADRIGIWLASTLTEFGEESRASAPSAKPSSAAPGAAGDPNPPLETAWRGLVWDRESESTPAEWDQLSGEAPLPPDLVLGGRAVEQELEGSSAQILIGVLIELRKVLWVPIESSGGLQGVILCGTREKHRTLPRVLPERLAAELALQLAWEEERRVARERHADLALARAVHRDLGADFGADAASVEHRTSRRADLHNEVPANSHAEAALARIVDSIVDAGRSSLGVGAAFAAIAALPDGWSPEAPSAALEFRWKSGDAHGLRVAENSALSQLWQEAVQKRRPAGIPPQASFTQTAIVRIVALPIALPIEAEGQPRGVMLVGLLRPGTSLAALERLEYRAGIAALALARWNRERTDARAAQQQRAQLAASRRSLLVLDELGYIVDLSPAAADLLNRRDHAPGDRAEITSSQQSADIAAKSATRTIPAGASTSSAAARNPTTTREPFQEMFAEKDRPLVAAWLRRGANPADRHNVDGLLIVDDLLIAELRSGVSVRLRRELPAVQGHTVVALEDIALEDVTLEQAASENGAPANIAHMQRSSYKDSDLALEGVIEWLEEGVVLFDTQDKVRARNTRFEQFAGLPPAESAKGASLDSLIAHMSAQAADPAKFAERWRNLARGIEGGVRDELRMTQPTARILERTARPVLDSAGRPLGRVEVYRDLTAQRVFQSQLLQTEKLAALGQMVSGIAHELSNPLTSILGYAQRLLLREDGAGRLPEVRQVFQEAERASGILRQLLFSAREAPPERRRVSLNQVILRSMELQRFSMAVEKIRIELDLDPTLPAVLGDAAQLQQVLMNLVGNARQAIEQKGQGGRIRVRTRQVAERRVQLEIEDDGPGVPQSILARIFDPFFTTKAEGVGTGLGLSIVLSIVREHGGRVNVLNAREGGAIFSIELPVAEGLATPGSAWPARSFELPLDANPETIDPARMTIAANHALAKRRTLAHGRILVVEDEPTVARLIADVLQDEGFTVEVLLDGREALKRAAERRFDLVICDMRMPGLDGQQFYQSLVRAGNELQHNFLFVTGDVIAPATQAFLERHRLPHLAKPFRVEELTERVYGVLDERHSALAALKPAAAASPKRKNATSKG